MSDNSTPFGRDVSVGAPSINYGLYVGQFVVAFSRCPSHLIVFRTLYIGNDHKAPALQPNLTVHCF